MSFGKAAGEYGSGLSPRDPEVDTSSADGGTRPGVGRRTIVLYYALVFLIVAIVAGLLGFGAIAFAAAGIAKILFFLFLIAFLVSLVAHIGRRAL